MLGAGQSAEDEIDDAAGVPGGVVGRPGSLVAGAARHPRDDRPVEGIEQEVDGGRSGKVASLDGSVKHGPGAVDVRDGDLAGEPGVQRRVEAGFEVNPQERPPFGGLLALEQPAGVLGEVVAETAGVLDRHGAGMGAQRGQQQVFLRLPAQVERGLSDAGPAGDGLEAEA